MLQTSNNYIQFYGCDLKNSLKILTVYTGREKETIFLATDFLSNKGMSNNKEANNYNSEC